MFIVNQGVLRDVLWMLERDHAMNQEERELLDRLSTFSIFGRLIERLVEKDVTETGAYKTVLLEHLEEIRKQEERDNQARRGISRET